MCPIWQVNLNLVHLLRRISGLRASGSGFRGVGFKVTRGMGAIGEIRGTGPIMIVFLSYSQYSG